MTSSARRRCWSCRRQPGSPCTPGWPITSGGRADAAPAVIAHHLLESLPVGDARPGRRWAERAAEDGDGAARLGGRRRLLHAGAARHGRARTGGPVPPAARPGPGPAARLRPGRREQHAAGGGRCRARGGRPRLDRRGRPGHGRLHRPGLGHASASSCATRRWPGCPPPTARCGPGCWPGGPPRPPTAGSRRPGRCRSRRWPWPNGLADPRALRSALRARQLARGGPDGVLDRVELGARMLALGDRGRRRRSGAVGTALAVRTRSPSSAASTMPRPSSRCWPRRWRGCGRRAHLASAAQPGGAGLRPRGVRPHAAAGRRVAPARGPRAREHAHLDGRPAGPAQRDHRPGRVAGAPLDDFRWSPPFGMVMRALWHLTLGRPDEARRYYQPASVRPRSRHQVPDHLRELSRAGRGVRRSGDRRPGAPVPAPLRGPVRVRWRGTDHDRRLRPQVPGPHRHRAGPSGRSRPASTCRRRRQ